MVYTSRRTSPAGAEPPNGVVQEIRGAGADIARRPASLVQQHRLAASVGDGRPLNVGHHRRGAASRTPKCFFCWCFLAYCGGTQAPISIFCWCWGLAAVVNQRRPTAATCAGKPVAVLQMPRATLATDAVRFAVIVNKHQSVAATGAGCPVAAV